MEPIAGLRRPVGRAVVGLEGEVSSATGSASRIRPVLTGDSARLKTDRDLYAGANAWLCGRPSTLLYVKGGTPTRGSAPSTTTVAAVITNNGVTLDDSAWRRSRTEIHVFGPGGS